MNNRLILLHTFKEELPEHFCSMVILFHNLSFHGKNDKLHRYPLLVLIIEGAGGICCHNMKGQAWLFCQNDADLHYVKQERRELPKAEALPVIYFIRFSACFTTFSTVKP